MLTHLLEEEKRIRISPTALSGYMAKLSRPDEEAPVRARRERAANICKLAARARRSPRRASSASRSSTSGRATRRSSTCPTGGRAHRRRRARREPDRHRRAGPRARPSRASPRRARARRPHSPASGSLRRPRDAGSTAVSRRRALGHRARRARGGRRRLRGAPCVDAVRATSRSCAPPAFCGAHALGGARVDVLAPCPELARERNPNDNSIVLRVAYGARAFLLVGDAERDEERGATRCASAAPSALRADVLKVGHHGSRTSSSPAFLAAVAPREAVVSFGARNRFGHPHPSTLASLAAAGPASGAPIATARSPSPPTASRSTSRPRPR